MEDQAEKEWVRQAFVEAHSQWKSVRTLLQVSPHDGWEYVVFQGSEIGRVKIAGNNIIAESLWGYTKLGGLAIEARYTTFCRRESDESDSDGPIWNEEK